MYALSNLSRLTLDHSQSGFYFEAGVCFNTTMWVFKLTFGNFISLNSSIDFILSFRWTIVGKIPTRRRRCNTITSGERYV